MGEEEGGEAEGRKQRMKRDEGNGEGKEEERIYIGNRSPYTPNRARITSLRYTSIAEGIDLRLLPVCHFVYLSTVVQKK